MLVAFVYFMNGSSGQSGASIHQSGQLPNMAKGIYTKLCKNVVPWATGQRFSNQFWQIFQTMATRWSLATSRQNILVMICLFMTIVRT